MNASKMQEMANRLWTIYEAIKNTGNEAAETVAWNRWQSAQRTASRMRQAR